ncbi:MAG: carboxypeptidase-like regulatory domain-containing protein, partial [Planctomycetota bacterium]|nr:carboxypeptidase-like regulatory domain-containing protein [Planctomycetota bacterium]
GPKPHLTFEMRQWVHLYGRVIDEVGRAVGNQRVSFAGRFSPNADRAQRHDGEILTDSEGRFVMPLHYRAQYAISAKMPGFAPATVHVRNFDPNIERIDLDDLVLRRPASISGKVLGRTYNRRIPDTIQVDLMNDGDFRTNPAVQIQRISITPDGEFTVGNLGPGTYSLTLLAAREESSKTDPLVRKSVKVEAGEAIEGITLTPIPPISGSVRLADGTPVSRVRMTIQSKKEGRPIAFVITDKNGEFSMAPEGDGPFILTAADRGFEFHQVQLEDIYSGMSGLSFVLLPRETEFSIQGRIVDAQGRAINGIHLRLVVAKNGSNLSCEAERDTSGNFTFKNLDEQLYSIHATDPQARFNFHSIYGIPTNGDPVTIQMERRF